VDKKQQVVACVTKKMLLGLYFQLRQWFNNVPASIGVVAYAPIPIELIVKHPIYGGENK